jgi:hypothetical protein
MELVLKNELTDKTGVPGFSKPGEDSLLMKTVANMASYAISSNWILVIHDNMIIGTNHIVLACLCRHF